MDGVGRFISVVMGGNQGIGGRGGQVYFCRYGCAHGGWRVDGVGRFISAVTVSTQGIGWTGWTGLFLSLRVALGG